MANTIITIDSVTKRFGQTVTAVDSVSSAERLWAR